MSADNGIYILKTGRYPIKNGNSYTNQSGYEYRVAHCQAIDNIDYSDLYMVIYFANSEVFLDKDKAFEKAREIDEEVMKHGWFTEYGICNIDMSHKYFPNITRKAAEKVLDVYVGCTPVDLLN